MATVQTYTVSDQLQRLLSEVEVQAGVFTTYTFDPGFFELEIIPVLFDLPFSHRPEVRIAQLDSHLRTSDVPLAVFYDVGQLKNTEERSAKLDIDRIPAFINHGAFHPKVFVIGGMQHNKELDTDERVLITGIGSGNLTRGGWWENVEFFHMEKIVEGEASRLAQDAYDFLTALPYLEKGRDVRAVETLRKFIRSGDFPVYTQRSVNGQLMTRLLFGKRPFISYIGLEAGPMVRDLELEILSPYIDGSTSNTIIDELKQEFRPWWTSVMLPTDPSGNISISEEQHAWLLKLEEKEELNLGMVVPSIAKRVGGTNAPERFVHAKAYRFTRKRMSKSKPRKEIIIGGSLNLTRAAWHGTNFEAAVIIDADTTGGVHEWLDCASKLPTVFAPEIGSDETEESRPPGFPVIQYSWSTGIASILWLGDKTPGTIAIKGINGMIGDALDMPANGKPLELNASISELIAQQLETSSMLTVVADNSTEYLVLVRETDMYQKAPVWKGLSISDILRFWSTLSEDKRAEIVGLSVLVNNPKADDDLTAPINYKAYETLFDRIGGVHQAFRSFHARIGEALDQNRDHVLKVLLFGRGVNGLHGLLNHLIKGLAEVQDDNELVRRYLIFRSAEEMIDRLERSDIAPNRHKRLESFLNKYTADLKKLKDVVQSADAVRDRLLNEHPDLAEDGFLDWFEGLHAATIDEITSLEAS